jgi:hypothetical protein
MSRSGTMVLLLVVASMVVFETSTTTLVVPAWVASYQQHPTPTGMMRVVRQWGPQRSYSPQKVVARWSLVNPRIIKQNGELFIMIAICECEYLHLLNSKINFSFEVHLSHEREWTPLTKRCHGRNGYQTYGVQFFSYVSCQRLDVFLKCSMACHPNERSIGFHHQTGAHVELQRQKM